MFRSNQTQYWLSETERISWKMLGGGNKGNPSVPGFVEEKRVLYDSNTLPQLQLFGHYPIQNSAGVSTTNYMGNGHALAHNPRMKTVNDNEPMSTQQQLNISLHNNFCQDDGGHIGTVLKPNSVSTGLKLSCEEEERNSSISSASENMNNTLPGSFSLGSVFKMEIDRQTEEVSRYIKLQEETILKGVRELNQRHTFSLLNTLEKGVNKKLHEKDLELESMHRKNKELGDRIKQVSMEAQSWHYRAKYNESVVNVLKGNIQQIMAQNTAQAHEGSGENEMDDAISSTNHYTGFAQEHPQPKCRACNGKQVSTLLLPCRHLCLCADCEGFIDVCPVCQVMKTASVHVYM